MKREGQAQALLIESVVEELSQKIINLKNVI
jgi:hypothetical protein